jgi:hypothetical protein
MIFAAVYKTYVGFSARRFTTGLRAAYADGLIDAKPHFNSVNRYMANRLLTEPLKELVAVRCKVLCHNICVIIRATHELGIEPAFGSKRTFGSETPLAPKIHSESKIEVLNQKWPKPCSRKETLVTFLGMVWLRAAVLGRLGGLFPSKSGCTILPIARPLRSGLSLKLRPQHLRAGAIQLPITPARASFYGRG